MATVKFKLKWGNPHIIDLPETSGTALDWYAGDPVKLTSGRLVIASNAVIAGIAMVSATGTQDTMCPVSLVDPTQVWCAEYIGTASVTDGFSEKALDFSPNSSGVSTTGSGDIIILKEDERDGWGANKRILVRFQSAACQSIA